MKGREACPTGVGMVSGLTLCSRFRAEFKFRDWVNFPIGRTILSHDSQGYMRVYVGRVEHQPTVTRISLFGMDANLFCIFVAVQFGCPMDRTRGVISALMEILSDSRAVFTMTRWTSVSATFVNSQLHVSAPSFFGFSNTPMTRTGVPSL